MNYSKKKQTPFWHVQGVDAAGWKRNQSRSIRRATACAKGILACSFLLISIGCAVGRNTDSSGFHNLQVVPDSILVATEQSSTNLELAPHEGWQGGGVVVMTESAHDGLTIELVAPKAEIKSLTIRWAAPMGSGWKYLGDAWERGYGDLEWKALDASRVMPWYFLASNGTVTHGYGVKTGPGALCCWTADETGITLHVDVRCGGMGVQLGERKLKVCTVVSRCGRSDETPFAAAQAFCKIMCSRPRLPRKPVYGVNDWYCTYGHDTAENFFTNVAYLVSLEHKNGNRPFAVVDDGWQWKGVNDASPGLWQQTDPKFSKTLTMAEFGKRIATLGACPGLWYRPLIANADQPRNWRLQRAPEYLDPSVPEVRASIRETMGRFRKWGYQLVKHDYSTYDICGRWGNQMGAEVTPDGWAFADRSKTTAEIIRQFYGDLRDAAGNGVLIIGCNTMSHLAAGLFEIQRIGDDTSGREWGRTRTMGVNSLAFRAAQNGTFYAIDGDCAGQVSSNSVPWEKNSQWLDLLARSGTPLFVSFPRETLTPEQERALRAAVTTASQVQPLGEPLDWMSQRLPGEWKLGLDTTKFCW